MKKISVFLFALYSATLCIPQYATAQAYPAGDFFRQEGIASWYGPEFDGRPTASGEIFNSTLMTAAHPTLPFGTFLRVTNRHNNRQVVVRVNDRGPFVAARIIDVSRAAAEHLDMILTGTAPVLIEAVQAGQQQAYQQPPVQPQAPAYQPPPVYSQPPVQQQPVYPPQPPVQQQQPVYSPPQPVPSQPQTQQHVVVTPAPSETSPYSPITVTVYPPPSTSSSPVVVAPQAVLSPEQLLPPASGARLIPPINPLSNKTYRLQVGSYKVPRNAVDTYVALKAAGLNPEYERNGDFFRVVLMGVQGSEVQSVANKLATAGFLEAVIREE